MPERRGVGLEAAQPLYRGPEGMLLGKPVGETVEDVDVLDLDVLAFRGERGEEQRLCRLLQMASVVPAPALVQGHRVLRVAVREPEMVGDVKTSGRRRGQRARRCPASVNLRRPGPTGARS